MGCLCFSHRKPKQNYSTKMLYVLVFVGEEVNNSKRPENSLEQETNSSLKENFENTVSTIKKVEISLGAEPCTSCKSTNNLSDNANKKSTTIGSGHRAGIDAFMTGYCMATYLVQCGVKGVAHSGWVNKISLSGKEVPLTISQSHFSKPSTTHSQKMKLLRECVCE